MRPRREQPRIKAVSTSRAVRYFCRASKALGRVGRRIEPLTTSFLVLLENCRRVRVARGLPPQGYARVNAVLLMDAQSRGPRGPSHDDRAASEQSGGSTNSHNHLIRVLGVFARATSMASRPTRDR